MEVTQVPTHQARAEAEPITNEKAPSVDVDSKSATTEEDEPITDIFVPLPAIKGIPDEPSPLTFRAVITGIVLGSLVNASNVYLGLKTGFTFPATIFGAIFGFGIIRLLCKVFPEVPGVGTYFGPQENSIVQAAATGAGGMAGIFVAGLPAMYQLNLLGENPKADFGRILAITVVCALFGTFAAVPLRKFFVINVARELNLVFPSPTATAVAIRSMHAVGSGAADAMKKIKAIGYAFIAAFTHIIVSQYADGVLHNWHVFAWIFSSTGYTNQTALAADNWGWYIQITPAFIGSGMLVGLNAAFSWWFGTVVAFGIIGPILVKYGEAEGIVLVAEGEGKWAGITSYRSMGGIGEPGYVPSPRYWFLWPGVMVLLVYSLIEFVLHFRVIWTGILVSFRTAAGGWNARLQARGKNSSFLEKQAAKGVDESRLVEDFAPADQQVPIWVWVTGTAIMTLIGAVVVHVQFDVNAGLGILACLLGLIFAFISIYGGAVTDTAPLTASTKASQLVYGGITHSAGYSLEHAQRVNLIAGNIASGTAGVSNDLVSDFRVGFLLRTPPRLQFYAQLAGAIVSVFLAPGIFVLFMSAYPCVWDPVLVDNPETVCPFQAPSVFAWRAVAEAVTQPTLPISRSCGIFTIVMGVVAALQAVVKHFFLTGTREKYRNYLPNWMSVGVAWVLGPDSGYANAVMIGAITSWWWNKWFKKSYEAYGIGVAAGLIAGEGLAGVINAALELGEVSGSFKGTQFGVPGSY